MKHLICLLLCASLLFVCTACEKTVPPTESESETSQEESVPFVENEQIERIRSYLTGNTPDRTMKAKNLFAGKPYTYNVDPDEAYADPNGKKLGDGITQDLFDKYNWVGFRVSKPVTVDYDFGINGASVADIEVACLQQTDYGIHLPASVAVSVSRDGQIYTQVGIVRAPKDLTTSMKYVFRFAFPEEIEARYWRITMISGGAFLFVDEILGYRYCKDGTVDVSAGPPASDAGLETDFYRYALQTEVTVPVSETDEDYTLRQNLARLPGVSVQAQHFDPMSPEFCSNNSPRGKLSALVDGVTAKMATHSDSAFLHFYRGYGRHIVVDLGNEMAVDSLTMQFLNQVSVGVGTPPAVMIAAGSDGEHWTTVYAQSTGLYGDGVTRIVNLEAELKTVIRCRYLRISFLTVPHNLTSCNVYLSEIGVYGTKDTSGAEAPKEDPTIRMGRYASVEDAGCENILFAAIHDDRNVNDAHLNVKNATLYLAYLDADGEIQDTFFDSVCFSPDSKYERAADAKDSADAFLNLCFAPDRNLRALEEAAEEIQKALGREVTVTVWFSFICPRSTETCSDLDGDGKAEDLSTVEGRATYLQYQVDQAVSRFYAEGYTHLRLQGYYWNDECIDEREPELDQASILWINTYLRDAGLHSFWCPYYNAPGYWKWQELGFDFAVLQPNYMFHSADSHRLTTAADTAKILGMGVELEIEDSDSESAVALYREYLRQGYDSGYQNGVKLYYQGYAVGAIAKGCKSKVAYTRSIYDDSYRYAKGLLDDSYARPTSASLDAFSDAELTVAHGKPVRFTAGDATGYNVRVLESSLYGAMRLNLDGSGIYTAMEGFCGDDRILLEISDEAGNRKTVCILFHVTTEN